MGAFRTPVDIANRALQLLRRPAISSFDTPTVEAHETGAIYDQIRLSELRRACWVFSTRRVVLRAISNSTMRLVPDAWDTDTTYAVGEIVVYNNLYWFSTQADNSGNQPDTVPSSGTLYWEQWFGNLTLDQYQTSPSTSYYIGDLAWTTTGTGSVTIYRSLVNANTNVPTEVDEWDSTIPYSSGDVAQYDDTVYQSLHNYNIDNEPDTSPTRWTTTVTSPQVSRSWTEQSGTLLPLNIVWPLGVGPSSNPQTMNTFVLPNGFIRQCPTDPKAGVTPFLGAPVGNMQPDWVFEGKYIVSKSFDPMVLRFVSDSKSVVDFDPMFGIALSARMAMELAPRLADAEHLTVIIQTCREEYNRTMSEAREVNGIEVGSVEPYEDDLITCRI